MVHLLFGIDDGANHLCFLGVDVGQLEVEVHLGLSRLSGDVHQTVHPDGVGGERVADVQVGERHALYDVHGL